jgi:hypothetical protein
MAMSFDGYLDTTEIGEWKGRPVHRLNAKLIFRNVCVPVGFQTDLASVPRVPVIFMLWGDRAHRPAVLHDYLYRKDSRPTVTKAMADAFFREAILATETGFRGWFVAWGMWLGVVLGGWSSYHKLTVDHQLVEWIDPVQ